MNIDENYEKVIKSKYIDEKKYLINFEKKDNCILIYIEDKFCLYKNQLELDFFPRQIKNLDDAMELLISNKNVSELKKFKNLFLYTLILNNDLPKIKLNISLICQNKDRINNSYNLIGKRIDDLEKERDSDINDINTNNKDSKDKNKVTDKNLIYSIENNSNNSSIHHIINENNEYSLFNNYQGGRVINIENKGLNINGIDIKFPFEPYEVQKNYMEQVLLCLNSNGENSNALLESPTGTGKTLSLLCSVLSWNENRKKNGLKPKKIIYCTRTISQINNLIKELGKIKDLYSPTTCILCSREKICPNEELINMALTMKKEEKDKENKYIINIEDDDKDDTDNKNEEEEEEDEENIISQICRILIENNKCPFYKKEEKKYLINRSDISEYLDIEDLKIEAKKKHFCPLYYLREKEIKANIIFMSYNYIFNDIFRNIMKIGPLLTDSILIVDEAHNILNICEDTKDREIDYKNIINSIKEIEKLDLNKIQIINEDNKTDEIINEQPEENFEKINEIKSFILEYLNILKDCLLQLYKENETKLNICCIIDKEILFEVFNSEIFNEILYYIEKYLNFLLEHKFPINKKLRKLSKFIYFLNSIKKEENNDYMFNISKIKKKKNNKGEINFRINIFCFNPGLEFGEILKFNPYRIILTSGTLSPIDIFESELKHNFYIKYQGNHIIKKDQLLFKLITNYTLPKENPTNKEKHTFYFSYQTTNKEFQFKILGYLLNDLCQVTPGGIIMFFPSYQYIKDCLNVWEKEGLYDKINSIKKIFNEISYYNNYNDNIFIEPINLFKQNVDQGEGGIFMSVFRGKISEGINLMGNYTRMLINVGIPFINKENAKFKLKEEYFMLNNKDFNKWYINDAILAMNQSCGRIIRNKNDYGIILNIDIRNKDYLDFFSGWLKNANPKCEDYKCDLNEYLESNINKNEFIQEIKHFYELWKDYENSINF